MKVFGIILGVLLIAFAVWQIYLLVRDIIARKKNKKAKANASSTGVGSTSLNEHKTDDK